MHASITGNMTHEHNSHPAIISYHSRANPLVLKSQSQLTPEQIQYLEGLGLRWKNACLCLS